MSFSFTLPWVLILSVLGLVPLLYANQKRLNYSSFIILPKDTLSVVVDWLYRVTGSAVLLLIVCGLAGPKLNRSSVERIGTGAHIVLLLDRSASMNATFAGSHLGGKSSESKISIAREVLNALVNRGQDDFFAMLSFSTSPVYTLPLTDDHIAVSGAIRGATTGGHGVTNIAPALSMALDFFYDEAVTGSRAILLLLDGAAVLEPETQEFLRQRFRENQVALYWIYLRTQNANSLVLKPKNPNERTSPEHSLHRFFQSLNTSYQSFEADNPAALKQAIQTIEQMENQPLRYFEKIPGFDLSQYFYTIALFAIVILLGLKTMEVRVWN